METTPIVEYGRARRVVKIAAKQTTGSVRKWLLADERGSFERMASQYLSHALSKPEGRALPESELDTAVAAEVAIAAMTASRSTAR